MPYIPAKRRCLATLNPTDAGELNYAITTMVIDYIDERGETYDTLNEVVGVLECAKQEFYRRIVSPYEDHKMRENGDVY